MKLIVGLGNPGPRYANTRHNIGFMVLDEIARSLGATWTNQPKLKAEVAMVKHGDDVIILAKPQTFMNLSGESAQAVARFYKIRARDIWAVYDDVDVEFGRVRIRIGGTSGHQGVRSLISHLGEGFVRARVGIDLNDRSIESSEEYVLKPFTQSELLRLPQIVSQTASIVVEQLDEPQESTFEL